MVSGKRAPLSVVPVVVGVVWLIGPAFGQGLGHVGTLMGTYRVTATPGELITNGSVERVTGSYGPTGWEGAGAGGEGATCDAQKAATGVRSLKLTRLDDRPVGWRQHMPAPPAGTRLRLRASVSAELDPGAQVVLGCWGLGTPNPRVEVVRDDIGPEWTTIETEVTVGEHTASLLIRAALEGTGTAWFDDFSLSPIVDGVPPTTTDLDVLLPLPPSCGRQALLAARLGIKPESPVSAVTVEHGGWGRQALRVHLEQVKGDYQFGWTALFVAGSMGAGMEVLDGPIRPVDDVPEAVRPFLDADAVTVPDLPEAQQQLALLKQARTYSDVASLSRDTPARLPRAADPSPSALAWRGHEGGMLRCHELTAAMFRIRKVPARVVRLIPLLLTRGPEPNNPYETTEVYMPGTGWVTMPLSAQAHAGPISCVLDVLPPGEAGPRGLPASLWTSRPIRLVYGRPSPTVSLEFGWAALPISSFPLTQDELLALEPTVARLWQTSLDELVAGAPPTTYSALFQRLRNINSADELAAALVE